MAQTSRRTVKYTSKDFSSLKEDLQNFAKNYFPNAQKDFTDGSTGEMFIELMSYVGDTLHFYQDQQFKELYDVDNPTDPDVVLGMARTFGYKPHGYTSAQGKVQISCVVSASSTDANTPDWNYTPVIKAGSYFVSNNEQNTKFELLADVDLSIGGTLDAPRTYSVNTVKVAAPNTPISYNVTKTGYVRSGNVKTTSITVGAIKQFYEVTIPDTNIVEIISVYDSDGNRWYEVEYLAQDRILDAIPNEGTDRTEVTSVAEYITVPKRFETFWDKDGYIHLQFGGGMLEDVEDDLWSNYNNGFGIPGMLFDQGVQAIDPTNFLRTRTFGESPANTILEVKYRTSYGAPDNALPGTITRVGSISSNFVAAGLTAAKKNAVLASVTITNEDAAVGGGGFESYSSIICKSISNSYKRRL